ncbi:MAG: hypothetical protein K9J17_05550 [Flavobacteriales bacterium]|nr:hypothetical protein [Flavobacteriales bacterium]
MTAIQQNTGLSTTTMPDMAGYLNLKGELETKANRIRSASEIDAQIRSQREEPLTIPEFKVNIEDLRQQYRELLPDIDIALNPRSQGLLGNHEAKQFTQQLNELRLDLGEVQKEVAAHPANGIPRPTPLSTYEQVLLKAPFILLGLDVLFEAPALRAAGGSGLISYFWAALLNGGKYFLSKFLNKRIRNATTKQEKWAWVSVGLFTYGVVAAFLGFSRHAYLQAQDGGSLYGPIILAFLSFFFSLTAWVAEFLAEEVRAKQMQLTEENKVFVQFDELEAKKKDIISEIKAVENERSNRLGSRLISMDNARSLQKYLADHYKGTVNKYQSIYNSRRPHGSQGSGVFVTDIPPLHDEFENKNNNIKEPRS